MTAAPSLTGRRRPRSRGPLAPEPIPQPSADTLAGALERNARLWAEQYGSGDLLPWQKGRQKEGADSRGGSCTSTDERDGQGAPPTASTVHP